MSTKITFVIFTYNEEKRIENVIKNFIKYGDVLIADNNSTDRTCDIAKSYGCSIYLRDKDYDFVENQDLVNKLYDVVETEWLYWAFADEMLEKKTLEKIIEIVDSGKFDAININRKNYYNGVYCYNAFESRTNKVFRKGAIDFTGNPIHGFGDLTVSGKRVFKLTDQYFVHHFISNTAKSYLNTINRYTDSELNFGHFDKSPFNYFFILPVRLFVVHFLLKSGYKAGVAGWKLVWMQIIYYIVKYMKLSEKQCKLDSQSIEDINNAFRKEILRELEKNEEGSGDYL